MAWYYTKSHESKNNGKIKNKIKLIIMASIGFQLGFKEIDIINSI